MTDPTRAINQMITREQLESPKLWLKGDTEGQRIFFPGADLFGADLRDADLCGANLCGANLFGADLRDANLSEANLSGANLSEANLSKADLSRANLRAADLSGAKLRGADLSRANLFDADLSGANLCGADLCRADDLRGAVGLPVADDAPARLLAVARAALQPGALNMDYWHTCETTHCMSGWAIYQAGEVGRLLESAVGGHLAGLYLLGPEAALHFYDSDEDATDYLNGVIAAAENQGGQANG